MVFTRGELGENINNRGNEEGSSSCFSLAQCQIRHREQRDTVKLLTCVLFKHCFDDLRPARAVESMNMWSIECTINYDDGKSRRKRERNGERSVTKSREAKKKKKKNADAHTPFVRSPCRRGATLARMVQCRRPSSHTRPGVRLTIASGGECAGQRRHTPMRIVTVHSENRPEGARIRRWIIKSAKRLKQYALSRAIQ
jgi:hypothetical protein